MANCYPANMMSIPSGQPQFAASWPLSDSYSEMLVDFYQVPFSSQAIFSTLHGRLAKRTLEGPLPIPVVRSDFCSDVIHKAESLRVNFPTIVRSINFPSKWEDLYHFFDGYDLYVDGVVFCFYVIHEIARKNQYLAIAFANEIANYAAEWIDCHREQVLRNPHIHDLIALFLPEELEGLDTMTKDEIHALGVALRHYRRILLEEAFRPPLIQPLSSVAECSRDAAASSVPASQMFSYQQAVYFGPGDSNGRNESLAPILPPITSGPPYLCYPYSQTYNPPIPSQAHLCGDVSSISSHNGWFNAVGNFQGQNKPQGISLNNGNVQGPNTARWPSLNNGNIQAPARPRGKPEVPCTSSGVPTSKSISAPQSGRETVLDTPRLSPSNSSKSENPIRVNTRHAGTLTSRAQFLRRTISGSGNSKFQNISNDARVLESMDAQGERLSAPSSSRVTTSMGNPRNPQRFQGSFAPLDIPFANHPRARISQTLASTYFYIGDTKYPNFDEQHPRTVYVGNVSRDAFVSHELHRVMRSCGEIESITYLNRDPPSKTAFVAYTQLKSVDNAICQLNGFRMESGDVLIVSPSRPRKRDRADSQFSQRSYGSNRSMQSTRGSDGYRPSTRRLTAQNQYPPNAQSGGRSFSPPTTTNKTTDALPSPTTELMVPAISAMSEVTQHQAALNRLASQLPLNTVQNLPASPKKPNNQGHRMQPCAPVSPKLENRSFKVCSSTSSTPTAKENSPNKKSQKAATNNDMERNYSKEAGWKTEGSPYNQNTSVRPTTTSSLGRSRSETKSDASRDQQRDIHSSGARLGSATALEPTKLNQTDPELSRYDNCVQGNERKQRRRRNVPKKKHSTSSASSGNSSFATTTSSARMDAGLSKSAGATPSLIDGLVSARSMAAINSLLSNSKTTITMAKSETNLYSKATKLTSQKSKFDANANPPSHYKVNQSTAAKRQRKANNKNCTENQHRNVSAKDSESYLDIRSKNDHGEKGVSKASGGSGANSLCKHKNEDDNAAKPITFKQTKLKDGNENISGRASYPSNSSSATIGTGYRNISPKQHYQDDLLKNSTTSLQRGMSKKSDDSQPYCHRKKASSSSSVSNRSLRKSDMKRETSFTATPNTASDEASRDGQRSRKADTTSKQPQSAASHDPDIGDPKKWPALGPVAYHTQGVVDNKNLPQTAWARPGVTRRAHTEPIIPAVPLLKNIRPQP